MSIRQQGGFSFSNFFPVTAKDAGMLPDARDSVFDWSLVGQPVGEASSQAYQGWQEGHQGVQPGHRHVLVGRYW